MRICTAGPRSSCNASNLGSRKRWEISWVQEMVRSLSGDQTETAASPEWMVSSPATTAREKMLALLGQLQSPFCPHEERGVQTLFQTRDVTADRRLGRVQLFGRTAEVQVPRRTFKCCQ